MYRDLQVFKDQLVQKALVVRKGRLGQQATLVQLGHRACRDQQVSKA